MSDVWCGECGYRIRDDELHSEMLRLITVLMDSSNLTTKEHSDILELLATICERYESISIGEMFG